MNHVRYSRRYRQLTDVMLVERMPCLEIEIVVERVCRCGRCRVAWWAEIGTTIGHSCRDGFKQAPFEVPA